MSLSCQYNDANQRTRATLNDGSFWIYRYDSLGQVISGKRYWNDGTPVPGQQFEYGFDDIGNRSSTGAGGDANGVNLRSATYSANNLNQYSSRTVPGGFDVVGIANAASSVTVNSSAADYRRAEYFQELINVSNSSVPVWQSVSVTTSGGGSASGNVWTPKTPENYGFDLDGNQTSDGRWNYTWDAENRLIRLVANTAVGPQQRMDFEYDWKGRRIGKKVWNNTGGTGSPATYLKFVYDGWNLIAELDGNNANAVKRSFIWGLDLSGREQGAGGVGGLLVIKPASGNPVFVAYDGNGNVTGLVDATTGSTAGSFEYGPFGESIRLTPTSNNQSPFRFSTKYTDDESDFVYYGYRSFNPSTGRWLSRDPIGEHSFLDSRLRQSPKLAVKLWRESVMASYAFLSNDGIARVDRFGLHVYKVELPSSVSGSVVNHRQIIGDDGYGGCYILEFYPQREGGCRICGATIVGPGELRVQRLKYESAADYIEEQGLTVNETVETSYVYFYPDGVSVDSLLTEDVVKMGRADAPRYVLLWNDCGTIANSWLRHARQVLRQAENSWPKGLPAFP